LDAQLNHFVILDTSPTYLLTSWLAS